MVATAVLSQSCGRALRIAVANLLLILAFNSSGAARLPRMERHMADQSVNSSIEILEHQLFIAEACFFKNIILSRNTLLQKAEHTPWSVHAHTYIPAVNTAAPCTSFQQIEHSLKYGQRILMKGSASAFQPFGCTYAWPSRSHACRISKKYHRIIFLGDSLIRQTHRAFTMFLREDLEYGALPHSIPLLQTFSGENISVYDQCRCDGQFSEHVACRNDGVVRFADNRQAGICNSGLENFALQYASVYNRDLRKGLSVTENLCTQQATRTVVRPVQFIMGGGAHFHSSANETITVFINPIMESIKRARAVCPQVKVRVVWLSRGVQDRVMDQPYPHQSREHMLVFNEQIDRYFREEHADMGVVIMDVWNLTKDARTSDGTHYLSDVNLVQAAYVLNIMEHALLGD